MSFHAADTTVDRGSDRAGSSPLQPEQDRAALSPGPLSAGPVNDLSTRDEAADGQQ